MESRVQQRSDELFRKWTSPTGTALLAAGSVVVKALIARGAPLSLDDAAGLLGWETDVLLERFEDMHLPLELGPDGTIVGAGLSLMPSTKHLVVIDGTPYYSWCALDAMLFPLSLGLTAQLSSRCPVTGTPISFTVTPSGIIGLAPTDTWLSIAPAAGGVVREIFCNRVNFYSSVDAVADGIADDADLVACPIADAWNIATRIAALTW